MPSAVIYEAPQALIGSDRSLRERFVYWRGASGARYLHTVYAPADLPEIDSGIVLLVRRQADGERRVARLVVTSRTPDGGRTLLADLARNLEADEVHVHALTDGEAGVREVARDLSRAIAAARLYAPRRR